jgi:hypothetical protein
VRIFAAISIDRPRGKVTAARFFARNVLPSLSAERRVIETVDPAMDAF